MSFLAIDEIRGKTSGTPTDVNDLKYQLATAWVNFNGTGTVAIRDSYNVSSITDIATGSYQINFAGGMDNTDFSITGSIQHVGGNFRVFNEGTATRTITDTRVETRNSASGLEDNPWINVHIHGGKN